MKTGRVLRVLSDRFAVETENGVVFAKSRKKLKRESLPLPGDFVALEETGNEFVLARILPRKNRLIRPPVANADQIVIVLAPVPAAEFLTVDKLLIAAHAAGIRTVVCVNKTDIASESFWQDVCAQYTDVADRVVAACAARGDVAALENVLDGKFSCFAGQSAVGKTSLLNRICGTAREVGALSEKTRRGKNTTTGVELIRLNENTFLADTPGFAVLDLPEITAADLPLYYDEYLRYAGQCRYHMCSHTNEPNCAVRAAVESGALSEKRYERYAILREELQRKDSHRKSWRNANDKK